MKVLTPICVERRDGGMAEAAIGFARHAGEVGVGDSVAGKRPDHLDRDFGIGPAGEPLNGRRSSRGQSSGT